MKKNLACIILMGISSILFLTTLITVRDMFLLVKENNEKMEEIMKKLERRR